jgi:hypothetical protein
VGFVILAFDSRKGKKKVGPVGGRKKIKDAMEEKCSDG